MLVQGIIPRPKIKDSDRFLRRVSKVMRENVAAVPKTSGGGGGTFEEVGKTLRENSKLFGKDKVHLTPTGTRTILTELLQYFKSTVPFKFAPE